MRAFGRNAVACLIKTVVGLPLVSKVFDNLGATASNVSRN